MFLKPFLFIIHFVVVYAKMVCTLYFKKRNTRHLSRMLWKYSHCIQKYVIHLYLCVHRNVSNNKKSLH